LVILGQRTLAIAKPLIAVLRHAQDPARIE